MLGIVLDGGADAGDVHVHRAVEAWVVRQAMAAREIGELLARQYAARALRQNREKIELIACQVPFLAAART